MYRGLTILAVTAGVAISAFAQSPAVSQPKFDVASIKPNHSGSSSSGENTNAGRLTVTNDSLKELLQLAFDVKDFQIEGAPGWTGTERFDIVATTGTVGDIDDAHLRPLLQSLLADRFALKFHREKKEGTVYSLVVAKNGPKLTEHTGEGGSSSGTNSGSGKVTMTMKKMTMAKLATRLERQVGRTVNDNTGLKGEYDFRLEWAQDQAADSNLPSLFTALQEQLGLKLDSAKGPVEILVIDGVSQPSEN